MSAAAEPADPTRAHLNHPAAASVIPLNKHRTHRGGTLRAVRGRRNMPTPEPSAPPGDAPTALTAFADTIETEFLAHQHTLTDPQTAHVYRLTLDIVARVLEGTHAGGDIDADQFGKLAEVIDGMRQAPGLV